MHRLSMTMCNVWVVIVLVPMVAFAALAGSASPALVLPKAHTIKATAHRAKGGPPRLVLPRPHTLQATAHRTEGEPPKLVLPKPHTLKATVHRAKGELPKLVLPKPHTLEATAHRANGEKPKLVLPKPHTLKATAHRAKGKQPKLALPKPHTLEATAHRARGKVEKAENKANLSGCWDDYTKHGSTETHAQVTIEQRGDSIQIKANKRTYQGRIDGASLHAEYQPGKIEDMMGKWWSDDGKPMSTPSRESLSQAVKMLGHMPVYAYDLTAVDRDHMSGTFTGLHIEWEGEKKKKVTSAGQVQWYERMVRKTGRIQSLRITGPEGKAVSSVAPGGQIRIEAKIESVCKVGLQSAMVRVYPGRQKDIGMNVTLIETAPGSGVLHSMPLTVHPGWSGDAVRVIAGGARGAKVGLSSTKAVQTLVPKVKVQPKPASSKKSKSAEAKPKQPNKPKQKKKVKQDKPVKWTAYKLEVHEHGSRLPTIDVLKLSFQKGKKRAAFKVTRYPVSVIRNDQTGKILWSINWSAGDVAENEMAIQPDMIDSLETMANDKKRGSVSKQDITGMINRQLGTGAERKE